MYDAVIILHVNVEQIVGLVDIQPPAAPDDFEDIYIMTELMDTDLHKIIYSRQALSDDHVQYFVYQVSVRADLQCVGPSSATLWPTTTTLNRSCEH